VHAGENIRVFPISNWTEMDIWKYIARENLYIPNIYYAHEREIIRRDNGILPVSHLVQPKPGEKVDRMMVRFRTVGDMTCTCPVASYARNAQEIIEETSTTRITERGATRMDDQTSEASMELRKKEGYF
jgi:sulfate adenylyltransferase subunit 2